MAAPMTMNRLIHQAVRRDFERIRGALGGVAEGDTARAQALARAFRNLRDQLAHHHEGEDRWLWPMLEKKGVDKELLATMESEHHAMSVALGEAGAAMDRFAVSGSAVDAESARDLVARAQSVVNQHLAHEEDELEPLLIPHLDSPEWKEVEKKFSRQRPAVAGAFFAWLTDGMTDEGQTFLRSTVPAPVTTVLSRVFGRRYNREVATVWR